MSKEGNDKKDWQDALRELEEYDRRRERRREQEKRLTPLPVAARVTPVPVKAVEPPTLNPEEGAARVPAAARDADAEKKDAAEIIEKTIGAETPLPVAVPEKPPGMSRYEQLCKTPSISLKGGDIRVMDEMSEILCSVNVAAALVARFKEKYPGGVQERRMQKWENSLRDVTTVMYREFHSLRHGRVKKTYDKRYVCNECHAVFMAPLPNGICDECRGRKARRDTFSKY